MKIVIAALASLAFATSAVAAVPSTPAEKKPTVKTAGQVELALGQNRSGQTTKSSDKYSNGKTFR